MILAHKINEDFIIFYHILLYLFLLRVEFKRKYFQLIDTLNIFKY
jgi:hypothetical protein